MKLVDMKVNEYMSALGSDMPAPGGGSAGALCGAQGAALVAMAASLTLGRKKYEQCQELCMEVARQATALRQALEAQIDRDTEAYNGVTAAYKQPKDTPEQVDARKRAIADAMLVAAQVPLETMELAYKALELATQIVGKCNANASSDLGVASLNLICCVKSCALNVITNLSGIAPEEAARLNAKVQEITESAGKMQRSVLEEIERSL